MEAAWLASATGFAFAMSATPGPNNAMVAASAANFGLRRTWPHMLGIAIGFPAMLVLTALGVGGLLQDSPGLQRALRWVGAAWLLWLAWRIAVAAPAGPGPAGPGPAGPGPAGPGPAGPGPAGPGPAGSGVAEPSGKPLGLLGAAAFQWVNPKAWMIAGSAIVSYTGGESGLLREAATLAAIFAVAALVSVAAWAALGAGVARLLPSAGMLRLFNRGMAALLVLSLLPILAE